MPTALVTGSAGFVGFHLCKRLLDEGWQVTGFDALTDYYDVELKKSRHAILSEYREFTPVIRRLEDDGCLSELTADLKPDIVVHLAAQAGVRYSIDNPRSYVESNLIGTFNLLEAVRETPVKHLLMASTSSVYGANADMPYREIDKADMQMSFYAATKKANEAMAHSYSNLYDIPVTMFRFFTVYGPWGRPDMALFKFTRAINEGKPIDVYNHGNMRRDYTYIDDLIEGIYQLIGVAPLPAGAPERTVENDSISSVAPFRTVNIGNEEPVNLNDFIVAVETAMGQKAIKNYMDIQPGEVLDTWADTRLLQALTGYKPSVSLNDGVVHFMKWYREYFRTS